MQLPGNRANILRLPLKLERGRARHHSQSFYMGEDIRNLLSKAVAEILIVRIGAQVHEWQDDERVHWMVFMSPVAEAHRSEIGETSDRRDGNQTPNRAGNSMDRWDRFRIRRLNANGRRIFQRHDETVSAAWDGFNVLAIAQRLPQGR